MTSSRFSGLIGLGRMFGSSSCSWQSIVSFRQACVFYVEPQQIAWCFFRKSRLGHSRAAAAERHSLDGVIRIEGILLHRTPRGYMAGGPRARERKARLKGPGSRRESAAYSPAIGNASAAQNDKGRAPDRDGPCVAFSS